MDDILWVADLALDHDPDATPMTGEASLAYRPSGRCPHCGRYMGEFCSLDRPVYRDGSYAGREHR